MNLKGVVIIGDNNRTTRIRFRNITYHELYINAIDAGCDAGDPISNGYFYIKDTSHFFLVNRSQYRKGCDFKHEIIENRGNNCFTPTKILLFYQRC